MGDCRTGRLFDCEVPQHAAFRDGLPFCDFGVSAACVPVAFFVVGIPGIALAIVVKLTLLEPIRGMSDAMQSTKLEQPPLIQTVKTLLSNKTLLHIAMGGALTSFVGYGLGQWLPAYFIRWHEMGVAETGSH